MPITSNEYTVASWVNNSAPSINASELQAMSNAIKNVQAYGTCSAAASNSSKSVTISTMPTIYKGAIIGVKFTNGHTASSLSLTVNGTTGTVYTVGGAAVKNGMITPGTWALLQYDGSSYYLLNPSTYVTSGTLAAASWTSSANGWTQSVSVTGLTTNNTVDVTPVYSATLATAKLEKTAWSFVDEATISSGSLTFRCFYAAPATDINLQIEVS